MTVSREYVKGHHAYQTYLSVADFVSDVTEADNILHKGSDHFSGGSWETARQLAKDGWEDGVLEASSIMEEALKTIEEELDLPVFKPVWDVAGASVDIGRYLAGEPECMVTFQPIKESNAGRVVTLVASLSVSASISTQTMLKRGMAVLALALALQACQHETEIWIEETGENSYPAGVPKLTVTRILLKSAHDTIRDSDLAYWLAHPTAFRRWIFAAIEKQAVVHGYACPSGLGKPHAPLPTLYPEGTIITPHLRSNYDQPEAAEFVKAELIKLGLLAADA